MADAPKILTVSYGSFSCTLEGFDDPFSTMKAIVEYFREISTTDTSFGTKPFAPDVQALHMIAEREVQRRVQATISSDGVILRQWDPDSDSQDLGPLNSILASASSDVEEPNPNASVGISPAFVALTTALGGRGPLQTRGYSNGAASKDNAATAQPSAPESDARPDADIGNLAEPGDSGAQVDSISARVSAGTGDQPEPAIALAIGSHEDEAPRDPSTEATEAGVPEAGATDRQTEADFAADVPGEPALEASVQFPEPEVAQAPLPDPGQEEDFLSEDFSDALDGSDVETAATMFAPDRVAEAAETPLQEADVAPDDSAPEISIANRLERLLSALGQSGQSPLATVERSADQLDSPESELSPTAAVDEPASGATPPEPDVRHDPTPDVAIAAAPETASGELSEARVVTDPVGEGEAAGAVDAMAPQAARSEPAPVIPPVPEAVASDDVEPLISQSPEVEDAALLDAAPLVSAPWSVELADAEIEASLIEPALIEAAPIEPEQVETEAVETEAVETDAVEPVAVEPEQVEAAPTLENMADVEGDLRPIDPSGQDFGPAADQGFAQSSADRSLEDAISRMMRQSGAAFSATPQSDDIALSEDPADLPQAAAGATTAPNEAPDRKVASSAGSPIGSKSPDGGGLLNRIAVRLFSFGRKGYTVETQRGATVASADLRTPVADAKAVAAAIAAPALMVDRASTAPDEPPVSPEPEPGSTWDLTTATTPEAPTDDHDYDVPDDVEAVDVEAVEVEAVDVGAVDEWTVEDPANDAMADVVTPDRSVSVGQSETVPALHPGDSTVRGPSDSFTTGVAAAEPEPGEANVPDAARSGEDAQVPQETTLDRLKRVLAGRATRDVGAVAATDPAPETAIAGITDDDQPPALAADTIGPDKGDRTEAAIDAILAFSGLDAPRPSARHNSDQRKKSPDPEQAGTQKSQPGSAAPKAAKDIDNPDALPAETEKLKTATPKTTRRVALVLDVSADDADVSRLIGETNVKLETVDNRRRHSAITHLKAAVTATEADRKLKSGAGDSDDARSDALDQFREDLSNAVRPYAGDQSPEPVAPQAPIPEDAAEDRAATKGAQDVRSSRHSGTDGSLVAERAKARARSLLRPATELSADLTGPDDGLAAEDADTADIDPAKFAAFVGRLGIDSLDEVIEAAGVFAVSELGLPHFSRLFLLRCAESAKSYSRDAALRAFGRLLREGTIYKVKRGQYTVGDRSEMRRRLQRDAQ